MMRKYIQQYVILTSGTVLLLLVVVEVLITIMPTFALEPSKPAKHRVPKSQEGALKSTIAATNNIGLTFPTVNENRRDTSQSNPFSETQSSKFPHPPTLPNALSAFKSLVEQEEEEEGDEDSTTKAMRGLEETIDVNTAPPRLLHQERIDKYDKSLGMKLVYTDVISLQPILIRRIKLSHLLKSRQEEEKDKVLNNNNDDIYVSESDSLYERLVYNAMYGLSDDEIKNIDDVTLSYTDNDGDVITISSTDELLDAIDQYYIVGSSNHNKNPLRLNVGIVNYQDRIESNNGTEVGNAQEQGDSRSSDPTVTAVNNDESIKQLHSSSTHSTPLDANKISSSTTANGVSVDSSMQEEKMSEHKDDASRTTKEVEKEIVATYSNGVVVYADGTVGVMEPTADGNHVDTERLSRPMLFPKWKLPFQRPSLPTPNIADTVAQHVSLNSILDGLASTLIATEKVLDTVVPIPNPVNTYRKRRTVRFIERSTQTRKDQSNEKQILQPEVQPISGESNKQISIEINETEVNSVSRSATEKKRTKNGTLQSWANKRSLVSPTTPDSQLPTAKSSTEKTSSSKPSSSAVAGNSPNRPEIPITETTPAANAMQAQPIPTGQTKNEQPKLQRQFIHARHTCDCCKVHPIFGRRYHAINEDYDLCETCYSNPRKHYVGSKLLEFAEEQDGT